MQNISSIVLMIDARGNFVIPPERGSAEVEREGWEQVYQDLSDAMPLLLLTRITRQPLELIPPCGSAVSRMEVSSFGMEPSDPVNAMCATGVWKLKFTANPPVLVSTVPSHGGQHYELKELTADSTEQRNHPRPLRLDLAQNYAALLKKAAMDSDFDKLALLAEARMSWIDRIFMRRRGGILRQIGKAGLQQQVAS